MSLHFSAPGIQFAETSSRPKGLLNGPLIGEGAYSQVYHYKDRSNSEFARKIFREKEGWEHEKTVYTAIQNSCDFITMFLGAGIETIGNQFCYFIDLELATEGTLLRRISSHGAANSYGEENVMRWLTDILLGLEFLQDHLHLAHNDLKPGNILLTTKNGVLRAKITDLGEAQHPEKIIITDPLNEGPMTPGYGPPELYLKNRLVYSSDTWSLGSIAYEMVTGCNAFYEGTCSCITEIDRTRKIVTNILETDPRLMKMETSRFPVSTSLKRFITRILLEADCDLRMRASSILTCRFVSRYLEGQHSERLRDHEFRAAIEKIRSQELELKQNQNDLLRNAVTIKKIISDYNDIAKELISVKKKAENLKNGSSVGGCSASYNQPLNMPDSDDEEENGYTAALTKLIEEFEANQPEYNPCHWALENQHIISAKYPSMRLKHVVRLYAVPDYFHWVEKNGQIILEICEFLLATKLKQIEERTQLTHVSYISTAAKDVLLPLINQRDSDTFTIIEEAIITLLYIVLRNETYVYRHLFNTTRRTESGVTGMIRRKVRHSVNSADKILRLIIGETQLKGIDNWPM